MARRDSDGESKQGLVIALVAFVILFVLTAVIAFLGYSDAKTYGDQLEAKITELKTARDKEQVQRARVGQLMLAALYNDADKKKLEKDADVVSYEANKRQKATKDILDEDLKKLKELKWEPGMERPELSYSERITKMEVDLNAEKKGRGAANELVKQAKDNYEAELKTMRDSREKAEKEMADLKNQFAAKLKGIDDNYLAVVKKFEDSIVDSGKYTKDIEQLKKERNQLAAQYQALVRDTDIKIKKLEEKIPQVDLLAYDQPKGKLVQMDRGGSTAYVNLGTADLVRPGLTFSVFGVGTYKPNAERKGSVEIINVISDHLSAARITEVRTSTRDPLLTGDLLYNPSWSPGVKQHIAVAGLIDLTGDGKDGTIEFVRNLEKQGVIVDAYLDIKEMAIRKKGEGITRATNYLVLGDVPEFTQQGQLRDNDPRADLKLKINEEISKLHETAIKLGVTIVPARRFMAVVGYKMPRSRASQTDWDSYLISTKPGAGGGGGGAAMPGPAMKKEEMKKEEMKKE